jgi:hypothetical protein
MLRIYFFVLLVFVLGACVSKQTTTGFLESYDDLKPVSSAKRLHFFNADANLSAYTKILIPEIKVLSNSREQTPYDRSLYAKISAYTTASYRKIIMKNSANYEVVDVPQKGAMVMNIALSMVQITDVDTTLEDLKPLAFKKDYSTDNAYLQGKARLLIEVKTTDALSSRVLARSLHVLIDEKVSATEEKLRFKDIQASLDAWLAQSIQH